MIIHATFLEEAKAALSQRSRQPCDVKIIVAGCKRKARDDDGDYHVEVKGAAMDLLLDKEYDAAMTNVMVRQIGAYGRSVRVGDSVAHPFHRESMAIGISGQSLVEATAAGSRLCPLSYDQTRRSPWPKPWSLGRWRLPFEPPAWRSRPVCLRLATSAYRSPRIPWLLMRFPIDAVIYFPCFVTSSVRWSYV